MTESNEPLPVGAHDPANVSGWEGVDPPGLLHTVDDLDREMTAKAADAIQAMKTRDPASEQRPDDAVLGAALDGAVIEAIVPRSVRGALLAHISKMTTAERQTLRDYAESVRQIEETRYAYMAIRARIAEGMEALSDLGLLTEDDDEQQPPPGPEPISDDQIV